MSFLLKKRGKLLDSHTHERTLLFARTQRTMVTTRRRSSRLKAKEEGKVDDSQSEDEVVNSVVQEEIIEAGRVAPKRLRTRKLHSFKSHT